MAKYVYGIGINDAGYVVQPRIAGVNHICPFYKVWYSMFSRCYSKPALLRNPTYQGCSVDDQWHKFSSFKKWMELQDWDGNQLDKDLLVKDNKVYGPNTCVFISKSLNIFMTERSASRGDYPIGVCYEPSTGKYKSQCHDPSRGQIYLGLYDTPENAHVVYRRFKYKSALRLAENQKDKRVSQALIDRYYYND